MTISSCERLGFVEAPRWEKNLLQTYETGEHMENSESIFLCYGIVLRAIELPGKLNQQIFPTFDIT